MKQYEWVLKYGKNQEYEVSSGYKYYSKDVAFKKAREFLKNTLNFYDNVEIEIYYDSQYVSKYDIIKSSFDIINLIEYNDYVNGERIVDVIPVEVCGDELLDNQHIFTADGEIYENEIKSIVTKEQFEQMSYKVGD